MNHNIFFNFLWPLLQVLLGGLEIATAVLLLQERGLASWLMLAGSTVSGLGQLVLPIIVRVAPSIRRGNLDLYMLLLSVVGFGSFVFSIGLLVHALRRRGQTNRIAELEAILASIQKS